MEALDWYEAKLNFAISPDSVWTFWSACYFAGTIYTTIGRPLLSGPGYDGLIVAWRPGLRKMA